MERLAGTTLPDEGPVSEPRAITAWIQSPPLTLRERRGSVVLVQFWTFDCINCEHVQPHLKRWHAPYGAWGLRVVGIHTPELGRERDPATVRPAVRAAGVTFPVGLDPDDPTWGAFRNRHWPAFSWIDHEERIRFEHPGLGRDDDHEGVIDTLPRG